MKKGKKQEPRFLTIGSNGRTLVTGDYSHANGHATLSASEVIGLNRKSKRIVAREESFNEEDKVAKREKEKAEQLLRNREKNKIKKKLSGAIRRLNRNK